MKAVFVGANIMGNPAMSASKVRQDLRVIKKTGNVLGVQEFTWPWYWRAAVSVLGVGTNWSGFPNRAVGFKDPSFGAQAIFWERKLFKKVHGYTIPAFDFNVDTGGIERNRYIRAALLKGKKDGFTAWFLSTHFVVDGSDHSSPDVRKRLLHQNFRQLDKALTHLRKTGYPIMGELDGNIHKDGWAYEPFVQMMHKHGAKFHGDLGIEFAFTLPGRHGDFTHVEATTIPITKLNTDHESRVLHWTGLSKQH